MKKLALIRAFCTSEEKENFLLENIKKLKSHNFDIAVISVLPISKKIMEASDYCFYTKENPVLYWPEKAIFFWFLEKNKNFCLSSCIEDYGFAVLKTIRTACEIFLNFDYEYFYHFEYDTILENLDFYLENPSDKLMFGSERENTIWPTGTHLFILDKINSIKLISEISKENYLKHNSSGDAYSFLYEIVKKFNWPIAEIKVKDKFYHFGDTNLFNQSETDEFKFFIIKNIIKQESVKIMFYDFDESKKIAIEVDGFKIYKNINSLDIFDLEFLPYEEKKVKLHYKNKTYDISEKITKIKNNAVQFL